MKRFVNLRLDPGATQTRAKLLLEKNKADLTLAKLDCEAGKISRLGLSKSFLFFQYFCVLTFVKSSFNIYLSI